LSTADLIWMNGEFVAWEDAKVHVLTHSMHYGTGVFEGIRAYDTEIGTAIFRHDDHLARLENSSKLYYMEIPFAREALREATHELIARNGFKSCYIRPLVYRGHGPMGLNPLKNPVEVSIAVWEWGAYLGEEGKLNGIRARTSSWRRISPDSLIPHSKASGQYLNSVLAKIEAEKSGYEEAILLDDHGRVCEGTGENVFLVKDGVIVTPPQTASILDGINRKSVIEIARDLGYEVLERDIARAELALADEVFLTGTAAELTPMRSIDDIEIGPPGEVTRAVQSVFEDALHGRAERYREWLDVVQVPART
jgi:branched-chain amino acid aminotransferase